jgi:glycine C-acetyltransferase/8-amino-7-oxononanoate synthase
MIKIEARLDELRASGLYRRTHLVSGPQGPHVVLDGKPVLLLCSDNYLGLADHARVRGAAAGAAMRWGAGAGASRSESGTMTIHRRLEERVAAFVRRESALLFGSGYLANAGVISALARPGDVVFSDAHNHESIVDGCRLSRADVFIYEHGDVEHLAWGIHEAEGRGALIATEGVFGLDGDVAPLAELVALAGDHGLRLLVDDSHGIGTAGPDGCGACAEAGVEHEVDVIVGTLGAALGSYGAFVACDQRLVRYLVNAARTFMFSTALPPTVVAAALAALGELELRPDRVERLRRNAAFLRSELSREGFDVDRHESPIISLLIGDPRLAVEICERALEHGVFAQPMGPPSVPAIGARVRLAVSAAHRRPELQQAARTLARAARSAGFEPRARALAAVQEPARATPAPFDHEAPAVRRAA